MAAEEATGRAVIMSRLQISMHPLPPKVDPLLFTYFYLFVCVHTSILLYSLPEFIWLDPLHVLKLSYDLQLSLIFVLLNEQHLITFSLVVRKLGMSMFVSGSLRR